MLLVVDGILESLLGLKALAPLYFGLEGVSVRFESCFVSSFCGRFGLFLAFTEVLVFAFVAAFEEDLLVLGTVVFVLRSFRTGADVEKEGSGGPFDLLMLDTELPSFPTPWDEAATRPLVDEDDDDPTRFKPLRSGTIGCGDVILTEPKFEMRS